MTPSNAAPLLPGRAARATVAPNGRAGGPGGRATEWFAPGAAAPTPGAAGPKAMTLWVELFGINCRRHLHR
ncbi:hypothetical protein BVIR_2582 [Blastochloris viridis]|uniref:Uncharacterized protein n=1 Tax=Blastochloris viridis TaxID=1079 RepID=A0A0P0JNR9_BLAVI|nr:hypothetical protein BVIR_2582 [Blastochloris viridis]CUU43009.1 hypothetical protein BVIRIDIS_20260 [Blastochloris viridis]